MSGDQLHATVVLPPGAHGRIEDRALRKWLSRGALSYAEPNEEMLQILATRLGGPVPRGGMAALRFWGQTGERSATWMAAADPVHLETRLHSLRIRALQPGEVSKGDLRQLIDHLERTLGGDRGVSFARIGQYAYLHCDQGIDTAPVSAEILHGLPPDEYLPGGESSSGFHKLIGEVQMALHDHEVNERRTLEGLLPVNSLWLWGGGVAPEAAPHPLPALVSNDPLYKGYWMSCAAEVGAWSGDLDAGISMVASDAVVLVPDNRPADTVPLLRELRRKLARRDITSLSLLFRDGLTVDISSWHNYRVWRASDPVLDEIDTHE